MFLDQLLLPYKFMAGTCEEYSLIFASFEPLTLCLCYLCLLAYNLYVCFNQNNNSVNQILK